jgi:hypothetical protein
MIEKPILARLASSKTILRTSEDESFLLQSVIDAIVDLSFPITTAYQELIADLVRNPPTPSQPPSCIGDYLRVGNRRTHEP